MKLHLLTCISNAPLLSEIELKTEKELKRSESEIKDLMSKKHVKYYLKTRAFNKTLKYVLPKGFEKCRKMEDAEVIFSEGAYRMEYSVRTVLVSELPEDVKQELETKSGVTLVHKRLAVCDDVNKSKLKRCGFSDKAADHIAYKTIWTPFSMFSQSYEKNYSLLDFLFVGNDENNQLDFDTMINLYKMYKSGGDNVDMADNILSGMYVKGEYEKYFLLLCALSGSIDELYTRYAFKINPKITYASSWNCHSGIVEFPEELIGRPQSEIRQYFNKEAANIIRQCLSDIITKIGGDFTADERKKLFCAVYEVCENSHQPQTFNLGKEYWRRRTTISF